MQAYSLEQAVVGYKQRVVAGPISAELRTGELCCLLGPNGAGKSTLLRTLSGFQRPLNGRVLLGDKTVADMLPRELATQVGVVLTDRIATPDITVRDMVAMGRSPYTDFFGHLSKNDEMEIKRAMQQVGVLEMAGRQINTLSDGERQKVMIAKALAQQTPVILLDEPTAFLDFPSKAEIMLLLRSLCHESGKTVLLSTHDLDMALQTADRLWLMGVNREFATGSPAELAADGTLEQFFQSDHLRFDVKSLRFTVDYRK